MRNLLTGGVFDKTFKAGDKFKEPDLVLVPATYLYSDNDGSYFLDQESYETLTLSGAMLGNALDYITDGVLVSCTSSTAIQSVCNCPSFVELDVVHTEPAVRGDTSSGSVTKSARLQTGLEIRVPLFIKEGEKVKVS